jgi:hypothetical protein
MNPMDYWYEKNPEIRLYLDEMFQARIECTVFDEGLREDMKTMYHDGNFTEKCLVLTVLSATHLYFE